MGNCQIASLPLCFAAFKITRSWKQAKQYRRRKIWVKLSFLPPNSSLLCGEQCEQSALWLPCPSLCSHMHILQGPPWRNESNHTGHSRLSPPLLLRTDGVLQLTHTQPLLVVSKSCRLLHSLAMANLFSQPVFSEAGHLHLQLLSFASTALRTAEHLRYSAFTSQETPGSGAAGPKDVYICGFDGQPLSRHLSPPTA